MENYDIQKLRELPIEGVAQELGLNVKHHKVLCPFHNDHHASLSFSTCRNTFRCFVCGEKGGTIDLVMRVLHKDFKEACRWLAENIDHSTLTIDRYCSAQPNGQNGQSNNGQRSMVNGQWSMVNVQRSMVNQTMVNGQWSMVNWIYPATSGSSSILG